MTLGVPHPPGYPTYVLLGRLATVLLPFGDAAHRLALFAALGGAAAVALLVLTAAVVGRAGGGARLTGCLVAGLAWGAAPLLWSQATIAEVYAPATAALAGGLLLLSVWATQSRRGGLLGGGGLLLGLGAGLHPMVLSLVPAAFPLLAVHARWRAVLLGILGLALGLSVFLLIPVLAAYHPSIAWGDPVNLRGFLWTVSGAPYRNLVFGFPLGEAPHRLLVVVTLLARQFGPVGWLLAVWGAWLLWRARPREAIMGGIVAVLSLVYALGYFSRDSTLYLIPLLLVGALWMGVTASAFLAAAGAWRPWAAGLAALALVAAVPGLSVVSNFRSLDLSKDREALDYALAAAESAGPQGLVLGDTDERVFSLWYYRDVVAPERSPTVIARTLLQFDWYRSQIRRRDPALLPPEPLSYDAAVQAVLAQARTRPLYVTREDPAAAEGYDLRPAGPLYRVFPRGSPGG